MTDSDTQWIIVDEREGVGRVDTWSEYLCVMPASEPDKIEIAICRYEMLGEIPLNWFDDEGQPLPEFADCDGDLKIPEFIEHRYAGEVFLAKLSGHDGQYLLGELVCDETFGPPIALKSNESVEISEALAALDWKSANESALVESIRLIPSSS